MDFFGFFNFRPRLKQTRAREMLFLLGGGDVITAPRRRKADRTHPG